jgi:hypothetical protein
MMGAALVEIQEIHQYALQLSTITEPGVRKICKEGALLAVAELYA